MSKNDLEFIQVKPIPQKYDIIHGYFFDRDQLSTSNKKVPLYKDFCHYMLVMASFESINKLVVILGTSTKRDKYEYSVQKNDLIIKDDIKQAGLNCETLFSINYHTIGMIESTTQFLITPYGKESPIVGTLSESDIKRYRYRIDKYPQITNIVKELGKTGSHMLSSEFYFDNDYRLPMTKMSNK